MQLRASIFYILIMCAYYERVSDALRILMDGGEVMDYDNFS